MHYVEEIGVPPILSECFSKSLKSPKRHHGVSITALSSERWFQNVRFSKAFVGV